MLSREEIKKWLELSRSKGIKDETKKTLLEVYKNIDVALSELKKLIYNGKIGDNVQMPKDDDLNKEVDQIEKYGAKMIHLNHSLYPPLLKHMYSF